MASISISNRYSGLGFMGSVKPERMKVSASGLRPAGKRRRSTLKPSMNDAYGIKALWGKK